LFSFLGASTATADGHEVNHDHDEPGHSDGGDCQHDFRLLMPLEAALWACSHRAGSGVFNQLPEGTSPSVDPENGYIGSKAQGRGVNF
jgi:hypothetical protein